MEDIENKIENIYDFIEDLYDLRKSSIADEGEFGIGNLVFKEFRNLGYLDYLKELMKELKSKKLSLESVNEDKLCESKEDKQRFIDKFGEDLYDLFVKSKDRLKNAEVSTDMVWHTKNTSVEDMRKMLYGLRAKVGKHNSSSDLTAIPGNHKYLGSSMGYDVYEPLDAEASMALGVGTGWCTTGRYGHAGDLNFKPSLEHAEEHWDSYTKRGIRFFYFLQEGIGKYALALYPKVLDVNRKINPNTILKRTNCELFDQYDKLNYEALVENKLPMDLISKELVLDIEELPEFEIRDGVLVKYRGKEANLRIPNSVTAIGDYAFSDCSSLVSVFIPSSVTALYECAFYDCSSLASVEIDDGVTIIEDYAFAHCSRLTSIDIPSSVTDIGESVFYGCDSLKSVVISPSVTVIGNYVFDGCLSLSSIKIPSSVTSIGEGAFNSCKSLTSIDIPSSVTELGSIAFLDCSSLTAIEIPSSITRIEAGTFSQCINLTSIVIPSSVDTIGNFAFSECSSLSSIEVPSSVTSFGYDIFYGCDNLMVHTDSEYVRNYCREYDVKCEFSSDKEDKGKAESLNESKEDIQRFVDKFGQELYDLFVKSEKMLKDTGESVDMAYHIENTSVDGMKKLLDDIQAKIRLSENVNKLESKLKSLGGDTSLFFNISKESSQKIPEKAINEFDAIKTKIEVLGKYGNPEISYIVWGIDLEKAKRLGLALKQDSILATTIENGKLMSVAYKNINDEYEEAGNTNQIIVSDSEEGMGNDNYTKVDDDFYYSLILAKDDGQTQKNDGFSQSMETK